MNAAQTEDAAGPAPAPSPPSPTFLTRRGKTRIRILYLSAPWTEPWLLPVDTFVLPAGSDVSLYGGLAQAWRGFLGEKEAAAFQSAVQQALAQQGSALLEPASPLLLPMPEAVSAKTPPQHVLLATAFAPEPGLPAARIAAAAIVRLAAKNHLRRIAIPLLGSGGLDSTQVADAMLRGVLDALPDDRLEEITLITRSEEAVAAARNLLSQRVQGLSNDLAQGEDLLNIEGEVSALAEGLMLRELNPPLVVGVLGGWGSGKSFVMDLMHRKMAEIRSLPLPDAAGGEPAADFPYVGHVYLIRFDAWTYAKSNLWASLMQTVFYELNRQLTLEKRLREADVDPRQGGRIWQLLYALEENEQQDLLENEIALEAFREMQRTEATEDLLWHTLRDMKAAERATLHQIEGRLADRRKALEAAREALHRSVDGEIDREARRAAWLPLEGVLRDLLGETFTRFQQRVNAADLATETSGDKGDDPRLHEIAPALRDLLAMIRRNWVESLAFALFFVVTLGLPFAFQWTRYQFPGGVLAFGSLVMTAARGVEKWRGQLTDSFAAYQKQVQEERSRLRDERPQRIEQRLAEQTARVREAVDDPAQLDRLVAGEAAVPALEREVQLLEAQAKRQRQRVGLTADTVSLVDFVSSRLNEAFYENQLGLMHQVQRDLAELTGGLTAPGNSSAEAAGKLRQDLFPRGPARVVLFIDDLDRCPPAKVVEVLEATQLLVKTSLFVVVLAMDVRFITRALEKSYTGILTRKGRPSGLDYIEKIIQIPYQVRPIEATALGRYLDAQMRRSDEPSAPAVGGDRQGPGEPDGETPAPAAEQPEKHPAGILPTKALEFSPDEFAFMERCCRRIDLTPRAVKRLVNVYKLLKILWFRPSQRPQPSREVEQAIVLLLALSGRYPDQMRDVLEFIRVERERGSDARFLDLFTAYKPGWQDVYTQREWQRLLDDLQALLPPGLTLTQMDAANFDLIQSFSFVGDIGYEPGDFAATPPMRTAEKA